MDKAADAFRTISEVADELGIAKHVLRFWEDKFAHIRPMKRGGGRRYYRPEDMELLRGVRHLLHREGYTIRGVQKILREQGVDAVKHFGRPDSESSEQDPAPTATPAPDGFQMAAEAANGGDGRKRGRRHAATAAQPTREPLSAPHRAVIRSLIDTLEECRRLLGAPVDASAAGTRRASSA